MEFDGIAIKCVVKYGQNKLELVEGKYKAYTVNKNIFANEKHMKAFQKMLEGRLTVAVETAGRLDENMLYGITSELISRMYPTSTISAIYKTNRNFIFNYTIKITDNYAYATIDK